MTTEPPAPTSSQQDGDRQCGGCQCGAVRYRIAAAPEEVYICHCTECRRQSASAFGISVIVPQASLTLLQGEPACWSRATDRGGRLDCYFCRACGSRLWHVDPQDDALISVKGGSLDRPPDLGDAAHIWTRSRLEGIVIPDHVPQFPGEPDEATA